MSWIDAKAPMAPSIKRAKGSQGRGIEISWTDSTASDASYYVVYRFQKGNLISADNPANIAAIVQRKPASKQFWIDDQTDKRKNYSYSISSVDRGHNESVISDPVTIRTRGKNRPIKIIKKDN